MLRQHDRVFHKQSTNLVGQLRPRTDQPASYLVQRLNILLLD